MIVRRLHQNEWKVARTVRLDALSQSPPGVFGSTLDVASEWSEQQWHQWIGGRTLFVAEADGGTAVGSAGILIEDGMPVVVSMWVAPPYRVTGLSDRLLHAVIDWARAGGHPEVRLWVLQGNRGAESLYIRNGFTRTGNRKRCIDWPEQFEVEMTRTMEPRTEPRTR